MRAKNAQLVLTVGVLPILVSPAMKVVVRDSVVRQGLVVPVLVSGPSACWGESVGAEFMVWEGNDFRWCFGGDFLPFPFSFLFCMNCSLFIFDFHCCSLFSRCFVLLSFCFCTPLLSVCSVCCCFSLSIFVVNFSSVFFF